jgi:ribosomal protein S10
MPPNKPNKPSLTQGTMDWIIFRSSLENKINLNISLKSPNDIDEAVNFLTKFIQETACICSSPPTPKNLFFYTNSLIVEKRKARDTWQRRRYQSDKRLFNNLTNKLKRYLAQIRSENFAKHLIALSSSDNSLW